MKDKHKSKKDTHRRDNTEPRDDRNVNILKEKYCKDDYNSKKEFKSHHRRKSSERESKKRSRSPDKFNGRECENGKHKSHRREDVSEESYEELSRKKRRIESELHALDLEEAKERKQRKDSKKRNYPVKVKEEIVSTTDEEKSPKPKVHDRNHTGDRSKVKEKEIRSRSKEESNTDEDVKPPKPKVQNRNHTEDKPKIKEEDTWGRAKEEAKKLDKEKPNFEVSGKLAEDTNVYNGVVIKYNEPSEARKPQRRWRLYPFKGETDLPFLPIHRQSAYLFGRTRSIADIPIDHPSCSKQHAVLQFRLVPYTREDGTKGRRVRPYIIDLESSNGTFVNNKRLDPRCYVELFEKDVIKFGYSSREYVILHEESKEDHDDDVRD